MELYEVCQILRVSDYSARRLLARGAFPLVPLPRMDGEPYRFRRTDLRRLGKRPRGRR